jgi:hypothetical protein
MLLENSVTLDTDGGINRVTQRPTDFIDEILKEAFDNAQEPPPLRLTDILHEIVNTLTQYLYFSQPATAMLIACWIAMTYCFREFRYSGYLAIQSSGPGKRQNPPAGTTECLFQREPSHLYEPNACCIIPFQSGRSSH